jgi:hypothetical protein
MLTRHGATRQNKVACATQDDGHNPRRGKPSLHDLAVDAALDKAVSQRVCRDPVPLALVLLNSFHFLELARRGTVTLNPVVLSPLCDILAISLDIVVDLLVHRD